MDKEFMKVAIEEAEKAGAMGEVPVGAKGFSLRRSCHEVTDEV
jgi:tRNA(Arg) A34 adenosine deaminase TadA